MVTPSSAAMSSRGSMMSSGRLMSALMRGATSMSILFICSTSVAAVSLSRSGSEPASITVMSRPEPNPPDCEAKRTRASGIWASVGASARSNSIELRSRSGLSVTYSVACPSRTRSSASSTSCCSYRMSATWSVTRSVVSSVVPGTISISTRLFSSSIFGWNCEGTMPNSRIVSSSEK